MSEFSDSRPCATCGKPAMQGLSQCGRCLADSILRERANGIEVADSSQRRAAGKRRAHLVGVFLVGSFVLAAIIGLLFLNSAGYALKNAQKRDSVAAYQMFLNKHGDSSQARIARARAAELDYASVREYPSPNRLREFIAKWPGSREESLARAELQTLATEQWRTLQASTDFRAIQRFLKEYPEAVEKTQAAARIEDLEILEAWGRVKNSTNLQALTNHANRHKDHETARLANQRIETLCSDYEWVKGQDKLSIYRVYLKLNPSSSNKAAVEKRIIDLEVAEILAGEHGKLPPASPVRMTGGSVAKLEIENATSHTLTVRYSGNQSYRFVLSPGKSQEFSVATGSYTVAASVASGGVFPYAGRDSLQGGSYSVKFYIQTTSYR